MHPPIDPRTRQHSSDSPGSARLVHISDFQRRRTIKRPSGKSGGKIGVAVAVLAGLAFGISQKSGGDANDSDGACAIVVKNGYVTNQGIWHASRGNGARLHEGIDVHSRAANNGFGAPIHAIKSGVVKEVGDRSSPNGWGKIVFIWHNDGTTSLYAHMDTYRVSEGEEVKRDQIIGTIGDTGNADPRYPHVHLEVSRKQTQARFHEQIDPTPVLQACGGWDEAWRN